MPHAGPRAEPLLELRDVSKYYGDLAALEGVVFKVRPGESVLVFGPNGAGKTTLMRTLASLVLTRDGRRLSRDAWPDLRLRAGHWSFRLTISHKGRGWRAVWWRSPAAPFNTTGRWRAHPSPGWELGAMHSLTVIWAVFAKD